MGSNQLLSIKYLLFSWSVPIETMIIWTCFRTNFCFRPWTPNMLAPFTFESINFYSRHNRIQAYVVLIDIASICILVIYL